MIRRADSLAAFGVMTGRRGVKVMEPPSCTVTCIFYSYMNILQGSIVRALIGFSLLPWPLFSPSPFRAQRGPHVFETPAT